METDLLYGVEMLPPRARRDRLLVAVEGMLREDFDGRILPFDGTAVQAYAAIAAAPRVKAAAAGLADQFSGHSGRVGLAQRMTAAGAPAQAVMV